MANLLLAVIYLACLSLGLPSGLLGAAWPGMHLELELPVSYAGVLSMLISAGSLCANLLNDRLTYRWGSGKVAAASVAATATALFGFSVCRTFPLLCLVAFPYGLGAGSMDASLNNYVALHYPSRYLSWLHCMWGLGAAAGPYIMGQVLAGGGHWSGGYRTVGFLQILVMAVVICSIPKWQPRVRAPGSKGKPMALTQAVKVPGAPEIMAALFCYNALEVTSSLWISSYLTLHRGLSPQTAASCASIFFVGLTAGRGISGFLTLRFSDIQLVRLGQGMVLTGIAALLLPLGELVSLSGLVLVGLGCAPIYPCMLHSTPAYFGTERSQSLIGIQIASAAAGAFVMPPLFGFLADRFTAAWLPGYLLTIALCMVFMHEKLLRKISASLTGASLV